MTPDKEPQLHPLTVFTEQWIEFCQQAAALARGGLAAVAFFSDPRPLRNLWLASLRQATDRYLRSTAFLQLIERGGKPVANRPESAQQTDPKP